MRWKLWQVAIGFGCITAAYANETGPEPRSSGGPGDKTPLACAQAGCHSANRQIGGPVNPAGGSVAAVFSTGSVYYPGIPVLITVTVADPTNRRYGFQMSARLASNTSSAQAGTFTSTDGSTVVICEDGSTRRAGMACRSTTPLEFIEHSRAATGGWQFTWTPGEGQSGPVHFYVAGNAVNFNGDSDGGDHVYTKEYVLNPVACTQVVPAVTSAKSGTDFGGFNNIAAGTWVEVKGTNLANSTRIWEARDFLGSQAPTNLDGVRVNVNGKPAPVYFVSPGQINIQAPADTQNGAVAITVTNCSGNASPFSATKETRVPGVLAPAGFNIGGKQYLVAQFQDLAFVGRADLFPPSAGVRTRPAKPGDLLTVYGIGFGDVTPAQTPGVVVGALNAIVAPVTLSFGSRSADLSYKGLAPGFVGLYQFNFTVPAGTPSGDQQINITVDGTPLAQPAMFLTIE